MPQPWFNVRAESEKRVSVSIRGLIGEWGYTDRELVSQIPADAEQIDITINSRGGEVDHALAIFNFLSSHPAKVVVSIDGIAASAASIIALAGDEIRMPANAMIMVHNPWMVVAGDSATLSKAAEDLAKVEHALVETYQARTGLDEADVRALLDGETYMTAAEAKEHGFVDVVEPVKRRAAVALAEALQVPESILAQLAEIEASAEPAPPAEPEPEPAPEPEPEAEPAPEPAAAEIAALCHANGMGAVTADWIREGITSAEAKARIAGALAARDAAEPIQNMITGTAPSVWDKVLNRNAR